MAKFRGWINFPKLPTPFWDKQQTKHKMSNIHNPSYTIPIESWLIQIPGSLLHGL